jgi:hypothetical protein
MGVCCRNVQSPATRELAKNVRIFAWSLNEEKGLKIPSPHFLLGDG